MSHSAAADIRIGTTLRDTYELTSLLGKGGMGSVFLARHLRLPGKQVAVKVLLYEEELSQEQFARFRREAEIASQLGHPNIVEVLDFHTLENGTPYLVMEYLRGESLAHRLRKGPLSIREAFSIARQMGSALQAAHRAGVVHRDLKPANVFLVPTDIEGLSGERVKLLDFGISKLMGSQTLQTQDDMLMGTPQYMSPEQAMGRNKEIDARTDIFAFGCIVYEMLSGASPFAGATIAEVVYRVVNAQPESLAVRCPDLPARAVAAVDRALSKNPQDRFAEVSAFILELTGIALQAFSSLGPDPVPSAPRGVQLPSGVSVGGDEGETGATVVPSRLGNSGVAVPGQLAAADASLEEDSTLASFRAQEPSPAQAGGTLIPVVQPAPAAVSPAPAVQPAPAAVMPAPAIQPAPAAVSPAPAAQPVSAPAPAAQPSPAAPPAPLPRSQGRPRPPAIAIVALVAALGGLGWWFFRPAPAPVVAPPAPVAVNTPAPPEPVKAEPPTPPEPSKAEPPESPPAPPPTVAKVEPPANPPPRRSPRPRKPSLGSEWTEAESAFKSKDYSRARRLAERVPDSENKGYFIIRTWCTQGDQSNAAAQWRRFSEKISIETKLWLIQDCKRHDVNLSL